MASKQELIDAVDDFFTGGYTITTGNTIPDVDDITLGNFGKEMELAMLFIDIKESTKIVDSFRRQTAAKMYKSFLYGVTRIALANEGELRSFNGDGVLVVFAGDAKCNNAVMAALQMSYFCRDILKPKVDAYMQDHTENNDISFGFGIGIDVGDVLIVRGGIRGENNNDLVWVGNATNYAVKLSGLADSTYSICISSEVYTRLVDTRIFHSPESPERVNIWEIVDNEDYDFSIYRTHYHWEF